MSAWAIYQHKFGTYVAGPDKGEMIDVRRVFRVASPEGAELLVEKWNDDARDALRIRTERLRDEPSIQTGKDAPTPAEHAPGTTSRLTLVEMEAK